jgi:hypothetical protein
MLDTLKQMGFYQMGKSCLHHLGRRKTEDSFVYTSQEECVQKVMIAFSFTESLLLRMMRTAMSYLIALVGSVIISIEMI